MKSKWTIDDFELGKPLGYGKFGVVWLVRERKSKYILALKIIKKKDVKDDIQSIKQIRREIEIQMNLNSYFIIKMFGFFHDVDNIYYMLEYAEGGELFSKLLERGRIGDEECAKITYQVAKGLQDMHKLGIIHRDLKPENILIGKNNKIKICDFGWAVCNITNRRNTYCGTDEYLSPEIAKRSGHNKEVDLWCLGILIYELLVGQAPFKSSSIFKTIENINQTNLYIPRYITNEAKDLLKRLIIIDPTRRSTIEDVLEHEWIQKHVKGTELEKLN